MATGAAAHYGAAPTTRVHYLSLPSFLEPRKLFPLNMAVQARAVSVASAVSVARAVSVSVSGAADVVNPRVAAPGTPPPH